MDANLAYARYRLPQNRGTWKRKEAAMLSYLPYNKG